MGGGLPLSGIETDDLVFRNLPFENELPGAGQAVTWFNNLPRVQYQLLNDCDADDCAFAFAAGVDGSQTGVWRQPKSDGGAAATPELLLWPGTQVPGLAAGVLVQQIGGMGVSDAGTVAVVAKVTGPGIRSAPDGDLPTNDGVVLAITPDKQLTLVVQMGEIVDLGLGPAPIDRIDVRNRAVGIPYVDVDFLGRNTRDQRVSHGSGIDGYNTTFNGRGCGQLLMRLGRFFTNSTRYCSGSRFRATDRGRKLRASPTAPKHRRNSREQYG